MVLMERGTGIPLDLMVFISSFLYERITDGNFKQVGSRTKWNVNLGLATSASGTPRESRIWRVLFTTNINLMKISVAGT
jgi:hypothetical protein